MRKGPGTEVENRGLTAKDYQVSKDREGEAVENIADKEFLPQPKPDISLGHRGGPCMRRSRELRLTGVPPSTSSSSSSTPCL